jgi:spore maturation protein CgeB
MGHDVQLVYYLVPQPGDEGYLPSGVRESADLLLQSYGGRKALMEVVFYHRAVEFEPDLILLAGMYHTWSADALADLREHCSAPIALWSGDDPYEPGATDVFTPGRFYDLSLFTIFGLDERAADDLPNTGFLPFGCDPERDVAPEPTDEDRAVFGCEVSYLGTIKLDRARLLDPLARSRVDFKAWGVGFPADLAERYPALAAARQPDHVQGARARRLYAASDIVLNLHHKGFGNMKFYEVASCGAFQVSNLRRDAEAIAAELPLFERAATYDEASALPALVRHWLDRPEERVARARELQAVVHAEHTWRHRLDELIRRALPVRTSS